MNPGRRIILFFQTVRYLKPKQIFYQFYYRFRKKRGGITPAGTSMAPKRPDIATPLRLKEFPVAEGVRNAFADLPGCFQFEFLNRSQSFEKEDVNWNFGGFGKLWTYNLNYFEFLFAANCDEETGLKLIEDYTARLPFIKDGLEPYPISLRNINWIKFLSRGDVASASAIEAIDMQYKRLLDTIEYHLMGNHLLENGFSLLFGGYYLRNKTYYHTGKKILLKELGRQLLPDRGHFEQSPMYHQIILYRLLDTINLVDSNDVFNDPGLKDSLRSYAAGMLGWLERITFSDGSIPYMNDAAPGIAPDTGQLRRYAGSLGVLPENIQLKESGFRMWKKGDSECCLDIGNVTANYQPGHTHADTFGFCLHAGGKPVIVDTGISTYEKNERRQYERSTGAHNTVWVNDLNSSDVWGGFRLGKRAFVQIAEEHVCRIVAGHDGYSAAGCVHQRTFDWCGTALVIEDNLLWSGKTGKAISLLHFHPDCKIRANQDHIRVNDRILIEANGFETVFLEEYAFCQGYNVLIPSQRIIGVFSSKALWNIIIESVGN